MAKIDGILVPGIFFINFTGITIATAVMRIIIHLEHAVMLDDPVEFFGYERPQDCRRHFAMRIGRQIVTDIVQ